MSCNKCIYWTKENCDICKLLPTCKDYKASPCGLCDILDKYTTGNNKRAEYKE